MENSKRDIKGYIITALFAMLHLAVTFYTDRFVFSVPPSVNPTDYIICKLLAFAALYALYYGVYLVFFDRTGKGKELRRILLCAAPYLIVIAAVSAVKLKAGYLSNDEALIYQNAVTLTHYTWFYYITTFFYITALMLIPYMYGPIFLKLIIELLIVGYVVYRVGKYFGRAYGYAAYLLFLLYPVLAYTTSAHRLPIYFLVYLYLMVMLMFDGLEGRELSPGKEAWIIFLSAVLTQWRTEGIYFAVISVILMFISYPGLRSRKNAVILITACIAVQYIVSVPQNGFTANELSAKADDRMKPFYAYTVTNMFRNGLDREKNSKDIEIIDRYLSVEAIDAINEYYGDINYEDVLILYAEGFVGVREEADTEDFFNYAAACKRLFVNNVDVLLRTRWGAFCYAALPYHISFQGTGLKELASFAISVVKTVSYNLFIPVSVIIVLCIYALFKKRWFTFFATGGLIAHFMIVFVLAPASYFKYYFPVYIMAYLYVMLIIMRLVQRRRPEGFVNGNDS
ncbi:MAG TPA: hypothetical protein DCL38_02235 [Lachnospiraceae bacterium]|nr:hypothetical protein [Lachnospiraceae bacterium]